MKRRDLYQRVSLLERMSKSTEKANSLMEQRALLQDQRRSANMDASFQRQRLQVISLQNWGIRRYYVGTSLHTHTHRKPSMTLQCRCPVQKTFLCCNSIILHLSFSKIHMACLLDYQLCRKQCQMYRQRRTGARWKWRKCFQSLWQLLTSWIASPRNSGKLAKMTYLRYDKQTPIGSMKLSQAAVWHITSITASCRLAKGFYHI